MQNDSQHTETQQYKAPLNVNVNNATQKNDTQ